MENTVQKIDRSETREISSAITPMQMLQIAVEQNADLDKLTKIMDLQERWEKNEARKAFVSSLNAFKGEPPKLLKNKHVSYPSKGGTTEYDHATLDNVCNVVGAALAKHNLSYRWETDQSDTGGLISVTCVLTHALGHSEKVTLKAGRDESGGKNNIQAVGSTVSYLQRYTLLAITGLAAADQDDDGKKGGGGTGETGEISAEQKAELIELIRSTNADTKRFLGYYAIGSVDELPASLFTSAKALLNQKKAQPK